MMETKGGAIKDIPQFVKEKFGEGGYDKWFNGLPEESKKIYGGQVLPSLWYPFEYVSKFPIIRMVELFWDNDIKKASELGRWSADKILTGIYKAFVKMGSPSFVISKAGSILSTFYRPAELSVPEKKDKYVRIQFTKFPNMFDALEYNIAGFIKRTLEICGCQNVKVEVKSSLAHGDQYTEFECSWD